MHTSIASPDKTVGFQDYNDKRYYFCCDMCPETFRKNPALYAEPQTKPGSSH
ncbi:MAG: YHS domain-containing protein [Armatimonadetes bacterium]|nr:YHS domain-containing protein [Armatimonadota bacterium]